MATKPNETYKWGENATHEQVAAYDDTGWPDDLIPPKRTQFNWYQNLVGKWLGWAEDTVDEIVETVLDAWFVEAGSDPRFTPNRSGVYYASNAIRFVVEDVLMYGFQLLPNGIGISRYDRSGFEWSLRYIFNAASRRSDILSESELNYVTPKGLVDYFRVDGSEHANGLSVPHKTGMYTIGQNSIEYGISFVMGDLQVMYPFDSSEDATLFRWESGAWVQQ